MTDDRVLYNEPGNWLGADYAVGLVDEIVLSNATVHFEMTTDNSGYLHIRNDKRELFARVNARPTNREERRQVLARSDDRLRDHLRAVLPGSRSIWGIPVWRRPGAAVREWWEYRRYAGAVLCVTVDEDEEINT